MKLCLTADNLENITWWDNATYAVHWDSRSHTGMAMSFGLGAVMSGSWRQKLNTGSSTEAELIGIDDALKYIMWGLYFIQAQGFKVKKNILMQDNNFDHSNGHERTLFMLEAHQAHKEQVLYDQV